MSRAGRKKKKKKKFPEGVREPDHRLAANILPRSVVVCGTKIRSLFLSNAY